MTFVWLIPLVIFVLFSSVILFQESIRLKSLAEYERAAGEPPEPSERDQRSDILRQ